MALRLNFCCKTIYFGTVVASGLVISLGYVFDYLRLWFFVGFLLWITLRGLVCVVPLQVFDF